MTTPQDRCASVHSQLGHKLRIELSTAKCHLDEITNIVTIYGGARVPPASPYYEATVQLAQELSARGFAVMSGGGPGIMEAANKGAQAGEQGLSIGLNITLQHEQQPNPYQDLGLSFDHFASRKATFCKYATAFVVMPGGFGTLDELFEVLTLIQTNKSRPVPVILYGREFWQGLVFWMQDVMLGRGLLSRDDMQLFEIIDDLDEVVQRCESAIHE